MPVLPLILEALVAAFEALNLAGPAAAAAAEAALPVAAASVEGGMAVEAAATAAAAAHMASVTAAEGAVGLAGAGAGTTAAATAATTGSKIGNVVKGIGSKLPGQSIAGKGFHVVTGAGTLIFSAQMIKDAFQRNPELAQQVANGDENAINELAQMMQGAQQGSRGNTQEQYNAIKANDRVDTVKSYLGANAPGAQKGVLGNRNDLQHLIQGHQDMLGQVGRQEPMSMLEAYARQGIVPPQGYR